MLNIAKLRLYRLDPAWELAVERGTSMAEEGGRLYLATARGRVMAVDAATGAAAWSLNLGVWVSAPPTAQSGVVYVGAANHVLYALDAGSGALLWYFAAQGEILARPVVSDGMVLVAADNDSVYDLRHRVYALDARNGALLWLYDSESWTPSAPTVGSQAVYMGGYGREVYALDKATGRELWSFKASNIVFSSPLLAGGKVVFASIDGRVYALDEGNGELAWSLKLPGFVWLAPSSDGVLHACSRGDTLTALSVQNGKELWSFRGRDLLQGSAITLGGLVCAFNERGEGYLLEAGELRGALILHAGLSSAPLIAHGRVYAPSPDGFVRAYPMPALEAAASVPR
jgi:outer membrane protein assembly factor BamB